MMRKLFKLSRGIIPTHWGSNSGVNSLRDELRSIRSADTAGPSSIQLLKKLSRAQDNAVKDVGSLLAFRAQCEARWGMPVTSLDLQRLKEGELFAMHKAIALSRYERTPDEVTEGFCTASGVVDGRRIEPRELFWQRFRPLGCPNGRVIVVSPRYGLTGRDYYDLVNVMNGEGYDVFTMDHQWAGLSEGVEGTLDSGYSLARDVASMVAYANTIQEREYGPQPGGANTILVGQGLGASAGVLGANFLNRCGRLELDGRNMPINLSAVVLTPYFKSTSSIRNQARHVMGRLPILSRMALTYHEEVSIRMDTPRAVKGLLAAIEKARPDLNRIRMLLEETAPSYEGQTYLIHGARDPFIDPDASIQLASRLGERGTLRMVDTCYPETESSLFVTRYVTDGLNAVAKYQLGLDS